MMVKVGAISYDNRIYVCSQCHHVHAFLQGETVSACDICKERGKQQEWLPKRELIIRVRNVTEEIEKRKNWLDRLSDMLVAWFGTPAFLFFHIILFTAWILINTGMTPLPQFDPNWWMLTMVVSLEAIFLAIFILINQNRAAEISELRSELDYQTDVKAEKRSAIILELLQPSSKKR